MTSTPDLSPPVAPAAASAPTAPFARPPLPPFRTELLRVLVLYTLSAVLLAWVFPPHGLWPLAFVALVPWAAATVRTQRAWLVHWSSLVVGWGFYLWALRWLQSVTGLGYSALAVYLALYWTLAAWAIRTARRHGIGPVWSLPIVWVATEFLRGTVMSGFPWLFLAHGLYAQIPLIQISDLVGAYGVSFVAAFASGWLVELSLLRWPVPGTRPPRRDAVLGSVALVVLLATTLGYGQRRLGLADFRDKPQRRGPRVAVIQEDFLLRSTPPYGQHHYVLLARNLALAAQAAQQKPDLVVFPETAWNSYQNLDYLQARSLLPEAVPELQPFGRLCDKATGAFARGDYATVNAVISELENTLRVLKRARPETPYPTDLPRLPATGGPPVTVVLGAVSMEQYPEAIYPKSRTFNSALIYDPDGSQRRERYDKIHLVPFGEYVPFRQGHFLGLSLHWLYSALNRLSPFSYGGKLEYSLTAGRTPTLFRLSTETGIYHFGVPICYEDATPYLIRRFVWDGREKRADFLVNISNDGWFEHSNELPQHLAIGAFRAVENRVSIARAVNTGISGFIDPDGRIYARVEDASGRSFGPGIVGFAVQPVYLDHRSSFYGRTGDWFAWMCVIPTLVLLASAVFERWVLAIRQRLVRLFGAHA